MMDRENRRMKGNGRVAVMGIGTALLAFPLALGAHAAHASPAEARYDLSTLALTGKAARAPGSSTRPGCAPTSGPAARVVDGALVVVLRAGVLLPTAEPGNGYGDDALAGAARCRAALKVAFPEGTYPGRLQVDYVAGLVKGAGSRMDVSLSGKIAGVPFAEASRGLAWGSVTGNPLLEFSTIRTPQGDWGDSPALRAAVCAARGAPVSLELATRSAVERNVVLEDARLGFEDGDVRLTFRASELRACPAADPADPADATAIDR